MIKKCFLCLCLLTYILCFNSSPVFAKEGFISKLFHTASFKSKIKEAEKAQSKETLEYIQQSFNDFYNLNQRTPKDKNFIE